MFESKRLAVQIQRQRKNVSELIEKMNAPKLKFEESWLHGDHIDHTQIYSLNEKIFGSCI